MRKTFIILTGIIFTLLTATCKQFTADIDDYLSYWASEAFIKSSNIEAAHQTDVTGIASVASEKDVAVTLKVQNPKAFKFIMPSASETRNIVGFTHFSGTKPAVGAEYEIKQLAADTLRLVYKTSFLKNAEWGEKNLSSTITLIADDGRVFKQTFTVPLKANTPPPKPSFTVVKTKGTPAYYVLGITVPDMNKTVPGGRLHKDITRIKVNGTEYAFSVDEAQNRFVKPESAGFITHSDVEKLTEPGAEEVPAGGWVLYYKTDVEVKDGAAKKDYTIKLTDAKGLVSPVLNASTKPNKVEAEIISITKGTKISGSGSETDPAIIGTDSSGAEIRVSSGTANTTVHCTLTDTGSAASSQYNGNPVTVPLPLSSAGQKTYKLEYYTDGEGFAATAVKTVYYKVLQEYTVTFNANKGTYPDGAATVSKTALHGTIVSAPNPLPTQQGYGLTGWYNSADGLGGAWNFAADPVTSDITLYAKWKEGVSSYTVEHYQQNINDDGYTLTETKTETGKTNDPIDADTIKKEYQGFDYERMDPPSAKIEADGNTVVKLYYKRKMITVTFTTGNAGGSINATPSAGGSVSGNAVKVKYGGSVTFAATPIHGYEVDSWEVSSGNFASGGGGGQTSATLSNITENKNVKVKFKQKSCTVTFKPNGGELDGNTHDVIKTGKYGDSLTAPTAEKTGYTLKGWSPALPSPLTFTAEDATYTAQWEANTYKVHFDGNGSDDGQMNDQTFTYGTAQLLSANGFTKIGHTFDGWATSAGGSKIYSNHQSVINLTNTQDGTVNLYAVWKINTYTVTFSVAGGEGGTLKGKYSGTEIMASGSEQKTFTVPQGSTVEFTATPDKGWDFDHWSGVSSTSLTATLSNITGDKTVTVKFKPGNLDFPGSESGSNLWEELKKEAAKTTGAHTIVIDREIKADLEPNNGEITLGRNLTIKGKNASAVLNADQRSRIFHVENGKTLTLENIKLEKGYDTRGDGGGVLVESGATLIMNNSSITGCEAKRGGGVYVAGTFTMEGTSSITSCTTEHEGSGVYADGTFTMKGSTSIQACSTMGVYVSGTFDMQDSSSIQNCDDGVYVYGTFNMQDSSFIQNCEDGVYVYGTFNMKDGAEVVTDDEKNDVYLASGRSINVTGTLTKKPAARITPDSYTDGRVLATGAFAEKANFKVTPKNGNEYWRYNKKDGVIKFVPATLTVTFVELKCVRVDDGHNDTDSEYFWTMNVAGKNPPISELTEGNKWVAQAGWSKDINESFTESFSFFPKEKKIPVDIEIWEYDKSSSNDHIGTTKAQLTYHYDHDAWMWGYVASGHENGNQGVNSYKWITEGEGPTNEVEFTEQYRTGDGDTDVTIKIKWKE